MRYGLCLITIVGIQGVSLLQAAATSNSTILSEHFYAMPIGYATYFPENVVFKKTSLSSTSKKHSALLIYSSQPDEILMQDLCEKIFKASADTSTKFSKKVKKICNDMPFDTKIFFIRLTKKNVMFLAGNAQGTHTAKQSLNKPCFNGAFPNSLTCSEWYPKFSSSVITQDVQHEAQQIMDEFCKKPTLLIAVNLRLWNEAYAKRKSGNRERRIPCL